MLLIVYQTGTSPPTQRVLIVYQTGTSPARVPGARAPLARRQRCADAVGLELHLVVVHVVRVECRHTGHAARAASPLSARERPPRMAQNKKGLKSNRAFPPPTNSERLLRSPLQNIRQLR